MKSKEVEKIAKAHGWVWERSKGDERIYYHPEHESPIVIVHGKTYSRSLIRSVLKQIKR
ncbi:type II toxin-antitoxin system HicA family toxin [Geomicrobium sp. JCM 19055]|uniref:type II toxin-antitoxin system HicA family toxin n=1 Tax=Geomicrobium sp. JCM 19055 TaxID=1460649 RepID=UPI0009DDC92D